MEREIVPGDGVGQLFITVVNGAQEVLDLSMRGLEMLQVSQLVASLGFTNLGVGPGLGHIGGFSL